MHLDLINNSYLLEHNVLICMCLQHSHYYVRIARFMPRVEIVHKHNTAARRLYIRGHNGKVNFYISINRHLILIRQSKCLELIIQNVLN